MLLMLTFMACLSEPAVAPEEAPPEVAAVPDAPPAEKTPVSATPSASGRQTFHAGRFSVAFAGPLPAAKLTETKEERVSALTIPQPETLWSVTLKESLIGGPVHEVDDGMVRFVASSVAKGATVLDEQRVALPELGTTATVKVVTLASGKREHIAIFPLDSLTLGMVTAQDRAAALATDDFIAFLGSFRVETPSTAEALPVEAVDGAAMMAKILKEGGKRTALSDTEAAARPTSKVAGEASVANSCQINARDCYETPHSAVGKGYYSTKKACMGTFEEQVCPSENRRAFCLLPNHQLISIYGDADLDLAANEARCTGTYSGRWLGMPAERPWPVN